LLHKVSNKDNLLRYFLHEYAWHTWTYTLEVGTS